MSHHLQQIYDVWGGNAEAMAADIDELGVTVRQWRNRRDIPVRAWPKIINAAVGKGRILRLEDFLPPDIKSELPPHALEDSGDGRSASATKSGDRIGEADHVDHAANIPGQNIRGVQADSRGPFPEAARPIDRAGHSSGVSSSTCSTTQGHLPLQAASPTSSSSPEEAAA